VTAACVVAHLVGELLVRRAVGHPDRVLARSLVHHLRWPTRLLIPLVGLEIAAASVSLPGEVDSELLHGVGVAIVLAVGFLVARLGNVAADLVVERFRLEGEDNLRARQVHTQVQILRRVGVVVVVVVTVAVALLTFPVVRAAGAGLLASAGIIGLIAGVAAKPIATNVLAGLQIALSQPIRVDDVVVVDGEWGRVEQIALTYVVVRVWDLRRLILPISYFIENPFENWTRQSSEILGWVHLEVDYSTPLDALRARFEKVLAASGDWDGQVGVLQVTGAGTETLQVRALMSSRDSSASWNLQCEVREQLIAFLQAEHPGALPRRRTQLVDAAGADLARPTPEVATARLDGASRPQDAPAP